MQVPTLTLTCLFWKTHQVMTLLLRVFATMMGMRPRHLLPVSTRLLGQVRALGMMKVEPLPRLHMQSTTPLKQHSRLSTLHCISR